MKTKNPHPSVGALARLAAVCVLSAVAIVAVAGPLANHGTAYSRMAPIAQYLMESGAEIALARSAAPVSVSAQATVLVLKAQGYEKAIVGTNGFTCIVERAWMAPFDSQEFWNSKMRSPICYNPAASSSVLAYTLKRTQLALAGHSREQMLDETRAALAHKELPQPEPGAMSFMMSKDGYLGDTQGHWHSHLMFHVPKAAAASWGANAAGSPVILDERLMPEPESIFLVPVGHWSDGTDAPGS